MRKIILMIVISLFTTSVFAKEPKNLYFIKQTLIKYHDSGEYLKDQAKVVDKAMLYLKARLEREAKSHSHKKFAVVLDIDETSLSNYADMVAMDFGGTDEAIDQAEGKGTDTAIQPTLELYHFAKSNHVAVFFITGRTENYRAATEKNLNAVGYKDYDGLTLKPESYHEKSAAPYKTNAREQIEKQGYDIILNMGDQESDLAGRHADKTFKLPNPYYFIP